ncbi:MAG: ATP-binding protein [Bacteroidales bacterium]|nr:ATP-binding protein [Bacteroidales bacterium]
MTTDRQLNAMFGLKYNPFVSDIPPEYIWQSPGLETFFTRVESLTRRGGFAMICGEPGIGKSKSLQCLASRLSRLNDVVVGIMQRPQSKMPDFYREMGDLFGVNLRPANRYGGFKALRERWKSHLKKTLYRPILLIDEAQEIPAVSLNELRILGSDNFDSQCLLTTVLCGDNRLPERFRFPELMALGSRIRVRLSLDPYEPKDLIDYLNHSLNEAGATHLMTNDLKHTLAEHSGGNLRILCGTAAELLDIAAEKQLDRLDEKLFIETYSIRTKSVRQKKKTTIQ